MLGVKEMKFKVTPDFGETFKAIDRLKQQLEGLARMLPANLDRSLGGVKNAVGRAVREAGVGNQRVATEAGGVIGRGLIGGISNAIRGGAGGIRGAIERMLRWSGSSFSVLGGGLSGAAGGLAYGLPGLGGAALGAGVLAGGAGAAYAVKQAADFESIMAKIRATVPDARDMMDELSKAARKVGTDSVHGSGQAAQGLMHLMWAGISAKNAMAVLGDVMNFAGAAELSVGEAAEYASQIMIGFRAEATDLNRIMEVMAKSAAAFPMETRDMGPAMARTASAMKDFNQSVETTALLIGALSTAALKGETAGYQLEAVVRRLQSGQKEVNQILEKSGVSLGDARTGYRSLIDIFSDVNKAYQDQKIDIGEVNKLFGESGVRVYNAFRSVEQQIRTLQPTLAANDQMMKGMATTMGETLWGATKKLGSALQDLGIEWGEPLLGPLKHAVITLTTWINKVKEASQESTKLASTMAQGDWADRIFGLDWLLGPEPGKKPGFVPFASLPPLGSQLFYNQMPQLPGLTPPKPAAPPMSAEDKKLMDKIKGQVIFDQSMGGIVNISNAMDKFVEGIYARQGRSGKKAYEEQRLFWKVLTGDVGAYHEWLEKVSDELEEVPSKTAQITQQARVPLETLSKSLRSVWNNFREGAKLAMGDIPPLFSTVSKEGEFVMGSLMQFGRDLTLGFRNALSAGFRASLFAGGDQDTNTAIEYLRQLREQVADTTTNTNTATLFQALMGLQPGGRPFGPAAAEIQTAVAQGRDAGLEAIDAAMNQLEAGQSFIGRFRSFFSTVWRGMTDTFEQGLSDLLANMVIRRAGIDRFLGNLGTALFPDNKLTVPGTPDVDLEGVNTNPASTTIQNSLRNLALPATAAAWAVILGGSSTAASLAFFGMWAAGKVVREFSPSAMNGSIINTLRDLGLPSSVAALSTVLGGSPTATALSFVGTWAVQRAMVLFQAGDIRNGMEIVLRDVGLPASVAAFSALLGNSQTATSLLTFGTWVLDRLVENMTGQSIGDRIANAIRSAFTTTDGENVGRTIGDRIGAGVGRFFTGAAFGASISGAMGGSTFGTVLGGVLSGIAAVALPGPPGIALGSLLSMASGGIFQEDKFAEELRNNEAKARAQLGSQLGGASFAELAAFGTNEKFSALTGGMTQALLFSGLLPGNFQELPQDQMATELERVAQEQARRELERRSFMVRDIFGRVQEMWAPGTSALQQQDLLRNIQELVSSTGLLPEGLGGIDLLSGSQTGGQALLALLAERLQQSPLMQFFPGLAPPGTTPPTGFVPGEIPWDPFFGTGPGPEIPAATRPAVDPIVAALMRVQTETLDPGLGGINSALSTVTSILEDFRADFNAMRSNELVPGLAGINDKLITSGTSVAVGAVNSWILLSRIADLTEAAFGLDIRKGTRWNVMDVVGAADVLNQRGAFQLPSFQTGPGEMRIVPGSPGAPMLSVVHGGETINGPGGGGVIQVGPFYIGAGASQVDERHVEEKIVPIVVRSLKRLSGRNVKVVNDSGVYRRRTV